MKASLELVFDIFEVIAACGIAIMRIIGEAQISNTSDINLIADNFFKFASASEISVQLWNPVFSSATTRMISHLKPSIALVIMIKDLF